jgi:hypothetical protein
MLSWASVPHWYIIEMFLFAVSSAGRCRPSGRCVSDWRRSALSGRLKRRLAPWFIVAGLVIALVAYAPFRLRFMISKPSMDAYARTVRVESTRDFSCRWVGPYCVNTGIS